MTTCMQACTPGSGAAIQVAALGKQDLVLRGRWSPFKIQYRRHVPFVTWVDEVKIQYSPLTRTRVDIPKKADFLGDMYLEIRLPVLTPDSFEPGPGLTPPVVPSVWNAHIGYRLLRRIRLMLDDQEIHNIERLWLDLYDRLYTRAGHAQGLLAMVGRDPLPTNQPHILYIPLRFLMCRKGFARAPLPLQAMSSSLTVDIEWEGLGTLCPGLRDDPGLDIRVLCEYADVDTVGQSPPQHQELTLAFESVIDSDQTTYTVDSGGAIQRLPNVSVNLGNVRFSAKAIVWVAYTEGTQNANNTLFEYIDRPLTNARITFNKQDRVSVHGDTYYTLVQPYFYGLRSCAGGSLCPPNMYSFCLKAMSRYHTGTANFGNLQEVSLKGDVRPETPLSKIKVFTLYHNVLRIKNTSAKVMFV